MSFLCGMHVSAFMKRATRLIQSLLQIPSPGHHEMYDASCIERTSLLRGSMTIEAAVVLPCFLFFFINLSSSLEMIRLHGNLQFALHNAGNEICLYGSLLTEEMKTLGSTGHVSPVKNSSSESNDEAGSQEVSSLQSDDETNLLSMAGGTALSYTYVKYRITNELTEEYLNSSPLRSGSMSLNFVGSSIGEEDDVVDIKLSYAVGTPIDFAGAGPFFLTGRYYGHLWNGYEVSGSGSRPEQEQIVYITEDSQVYHTTTTCTHLKLTIRGVEYSNLENERNRSGGRYYPCEICAHGEAPDVVYICAEGDRYHFMFDCYTLTRSYTPVPLSEVEDSHRPCSRCGG